ncbi:DUF2163 domain-containing protein [Methylobacterium pseudosasicola]|uniref:Bacteriophage phiJL001 Gp84 C-terminal domain-containing protein n=1 Tax=Methylobacterium pseudosasicola TaxID=582667 RepID=A0A1I4GNZ3_9HYPH|nr:DUF2163 domain-containing protein [Methylobacterium pseudosasicola]SFL31097.1 phage conserved hypothetical protein BR0599 [Methylobacterium pseudosasicola]
MRDIPNAFAAHLAGGVTTLCRCWSLRRRDGVALGFTDHDCDLGLAGLVHAARTGLEAAEASAESGFAVSGGDVAGALSSLGLTEADIAGGLYDGATVETWLVDWTNPKTRLLIDVGTIGEVRREGDAFVAELRGLAHRLGAERGRTFRATCGADLGDGRCRVDLAAWQTTGRVTGLPEPATLSVTLAGGFADGLFTGGMLTWTEGANAGLRADIRLQLGTLLELWTVPPRPVAAGDAFSLTAGCDKRLATCRDRFANAINFQGFPHMPGNDAVMRAVPGSEPVLDGGSLFR